MEYTVEELIERLRKWKMYYFRCVQCALKEEAADLQKTMSEAADMLERYTKE